MDFVIELRLRLSFARTRAIAAACIVCTAACAGTPVARDAAGGGASAPAPPSSITGVVDPPLSPRNASYAIDARLDPASRTISASATIGWRNITANPTSELQFHLYWNGWKDLQSTFMRESGVTSDEAPPASSFGSIDVTAVRLVSPTEMDLTATRRFVASPGENPDDETVLAVQLPAPIGPGAIATIEVTWTARVPRTFARTGAIGDFFFIAQWFPKLGVLQDAGWHARQFHAATEFFSDYGVYDVRLTVPRNWMVGATGVERDRVDNADGTATHRYYQEDVHDFAWTTSPDYLERTAWFEPQGSAAAGGRVRMRLLLQEEHLRQVERHFDATRAALQAFGEWAGPYPYGHITIVDPAYQSEVDGMEYPTLFTAGTRWLVPEVVTINGPEEVVIHEAGHQWWYGLIGSNEFDAAWMDEGITTYATARALEEHYAGTYLEHRYFGGFVPWVFKDIRLSRETFWNRRAGYRTAAKSDVPSTPSYLYHPVTGRYVTYNKTALWLNTAERWLGWPVMQKALATFSERWRFRHPEPGDFFASVAAAAGRDLTWFFDAVHRSSDVFDYGIETLRSSEDDGRFRTEIIARRYGEAMFPVDVVVTFEDGQRVTERWDGRDRWTRYTYERESRARSAQVDPERVLLLDLDFTNNSMTLAPQGPAAATKWSLKWMVWLQDALLSWAFFV